MEHHVPIFGVRDENLPQRTRICAYAVVANSEGFIAVVRESAGHLLLPGGGIESGETPAQAVQREVLEELGRGIELNRRIGQAMQYIIADGHCQATYATFFGGELGEITAPSHEHELEWAPAERLHHPYQAWAAQKYLKQSASASPHR
jgi:8-oxo-dGTP pyrophosphatase MutT (NUDIX family)